VKDTSASYWVCVSGPGGPVDCIHVSQKIVLQKLERLCLRDAVDVRSFRRVIRTDPTIVYKMPVADCGVVRGIVVKPSYKLLLAGDKIHARLTYRVCASLRARHDNLHLHGDPCLVAGSDLQHARAD